jgi:anthranilate/para-aminobenzoate synthase component I
MSSTIIGEPLQPAIEVALGCFPPGSMTGAPKIHAVKLCDELEGIERGVYSGALGYFGGDGSCDLSVVIRTMILNDKKFEFQVGGGIVADSKPQSELEETKTKSRPILECI